MSTDAQLEAYAAADLSGLADEARVAIVLCGDDGATYDEVEMLTGALRVSIRRAVNELRNLGVIMDSGEKRLGDSGANQTVWKLGDDRATVEAHRRRKLFRLADLLGFDVVKREAS